LRDKRPIFNVSPPHRGTVRLPNSRVERAAAGAVEILAIFATSAIFVLLLAGCGRSGPKADVTITLDGAHHACVVALSREAQGSIISCSDVVPFIRDELRLPSGSTYDVRTNSDVDRAEVASVGARLKDAGYRVAGTS
jgi:hypothetical protein